MMGHTIHPDDIMLWPDKFWCYRHEYRDDMLRNSGYRIVLNLSDEWAKVLDVNATSNHLTGKTSSL
jgi:hypothetical protein